MELSPYSGLQWSDLPFIIEGAWRTILLTLLSGTFGTLLGLFIGWLREYSLALRFASAPYIDITRSVPLIIQFILVNSCFSAFGAPLDPLQVGVLTLSLYMGVQTSELVRAGLRSVRPEIKKAGRSLGMSYWQELLHISVPLATRAIFPGWIGTLIGLTKDTALVSVVGYVELLRASQIVIDRSNQALTVLGAAGLFYFVICYPVSKYGRRFERRMQHD